MDIVKKNVSVVDSAIDILKEGKLEEAFAKLKHLALVEKDPESLWYYAEAFRLGGWGVPTLDLKEAFSAMKQSAELGYAPACAVLCRMYMQGIGVEEDKEKARHFCNVVMNSDSSNNSYAKGYIYYHGCDTGMRNFKEAAKYYEMSAEEGFISGMNNIGWCLCGSGRKFVQLFL